MDRFWDKVRKGDGCWEWTGAKVKNKGVLYLNGKNKYAHILAYELSNGEVPAGSMVKNSCENLGCVKPEHLVLKSEYDRFWKNVDKTGDCWEWTGAKQTRGYGMYSIKNKRHTAHRISWEMENGEIPKGKMILHKCDNKVCVRPEHLFIGTAWDNTHDMMDKGRMSHHNAASGEKIFTAKLSWDIVKSIRSEYDGSRGQIKQFSERLGVARHTITNVLKNKTWKVS